MLRLRYVALLSAIGCSPVKDASNVPDASIDAMDTRPPMIESSNPANMATKVSVLQPISVFFDEPLDPASVTAETVKLGYQPTSPDMYLTGGLYAPWGAGQAGLIRVNGAVSYDAAARKISFVPTLPLPYGSIFTLSIAVKDTAGLELATKLTFTTYVNLNTKQHFFNVTTGVPTSWYGFPPDANGWQTKRIRSASPGADGLWFTSDDPRTEHYGFTYASDGRVSNERRYTIGTDNLWDTPDDVVSHCTAYSYDAEGRLAQRAYSNQPGGDTMLCTGDDIPSHHYVYEYRDGVLTGWLLNTAPGDDGMWRNGDDRCSYYYDVEYDAQGNKTREIMKYCANDGLPRTNDDTVVWYHEYEYDANNLVVKSTCTPARGPTGCG